MMKGDAFLWTIAIPLAGAILCFVVPRTSRAAGMAVFPLLAWPLWRCVVEVRSQGAAVHEAGEWAAPLGIALSLDGATLWLLCTGWAVGTAVSLYASAYFGKKSESRFFWPLFLLLIAGLNALFLSRDVFNLYVTLEIVGIAAVALVALPGKKEAVVAAMRYLLVSLLGSLCYLLGVALLYAEYSTVDLVLLSESVSGSPATLLAAAVMTGGLLLKAALFPLHFWLPPAHANAPAPVSALLSALVVKGSLVILLRLWTQVFAETVSPAAIHALGVLGAGAILWGSMQALLQARLKMLVAYSTVAQLGYLFLVFPLFLNEARPLAAWTGFFYFLASHACAKTAMFLAAGSIMHAAGHDRIRDLGGIAKVAPLSMWAFGLAGISIVGLPPSGGFLGKWMLLNAALGEGQWWWVAVIAFGGLLAGAYVLRVVALAFFGEGTESGAGKPARVMEWSALAMGAIAIALGLLSALPIEMIGIDAPTAAGSLLKGGPAS